MMAECRATEATRRRSAADGGLVALVAPDADEASDLRLAVTGFCRPLAPSVEDGELVVATELRGSTETIALPAAGLFAGALRRNGLRVHEGPVVAEERRSDSIGALAVDPGQYEWCSSGAKPPPVVVVLMAIREARTPQALQTLGRAANVLSGCAEAMRPRTVLVAAPRASCAGVERAIESVETALEQSGPPIYVRKQIVHNAHVVSDLERRGVVFVDELGEVPDGATVVFSAHGVAPSVRSAAHTRGLTVVDATCPLVSKVHAEARRFADSGHTIVLVGHEGHEEVEGIVGEAPAATRVVESVQDVDVVEVEDPERVAYLTQTTLALDDTEETVAALRARYPALVGPPKSDICYATQNRQDAVKVLAAECDLVLVIGSTNSSNSRRLAEVARRAGTAAKLIDDESDIEPAWLARADTIGITAGASAPESLVQRVLAALTALGRTRVEQRRTAVENVRFKRPPIRRARPDGED